MSERIVPGSVRRTLRKHKLTEEYDEFAQGGPVVPFDQANVVTSESLDWPGMHVPVIDLDMPCTLVPSSNPGHFHLYIDHPVNWPAYVRALEALRDAGIVQPGFVHAAQERGYTTARLPWVKKEQS